MALQCNYNTTHGLTITNAYIKITYIYGDKNKLRVDYAIFPNKQSSDLSKPAIDSVPITLDYDLNYQGNAIQFAYIELKKLPLFSTALDV